MGVYVNDWSINEKMAFLFIWKQGRGFFEMIEKKSAESQVFLKRKDLFWNKEEANLKKRKLD